MIRRTSDGVGRRKWPLFIAAALTLGTVSVVGQAQAATSHQPFGKLDAVAQSGTGIALHGWAIDPDTRAALHVDVYVDGQGTRLTASGSRPDIGRAYPKYGAGHGYSAQFTVAAGQHTVCAYAINAGAGSGHTTLGCRTLTVNFSPFGSISAVTHAPGGFTVTGWTIDHDRPTLPLPVKLTLDDPTNSVGTGTANLVRPDVAKVYPSAGAAHGFSFTVHAVEGTHTACIVATNRGLGSNTQVACRTFALHFSPIGAFDKLTREGSVHLRITGWAIDPDTAAKSPVRVTIDGAVAGTSLAGMSRIDIAERYPGYGAAHGVSVVYAASSGEHKVCLTGVNVLTGAGDTPLGCRIINAVHPAAPSSPGTVKAVGGFGSATVTWAAPLRDGGAPVNGYTVRVWPGGRSVTVAASARTATVAGLAANRRYSFTVGARNVAGTSVARSSAIIRTQINPPPQTSPAPISTSRYIRNISGSSSTDLNKMRAEGAADASHNPSGHVYLALLDIGGQDQARQGVLLSATTRFVSYANLVRCLNAYVDGYLSTQKASAPVTIALGTNNDMDVSTSAGSSWARSVVHPVAVHAAGRLGLKIAGANDIEPGFRGTYAQTKAWLSGYLGGTSAPFIFNGSADGCAWTATARNCNNGWKMSGLYNLSAGASPSRIVNLPQIYNNTMAAQWKYISLTGIAARLPKINFGGALTEWTACSQSGGCGSLTGRNAWIQMWQQLQSHPATRTHSLPYSTDLRIDR